MLPMISQFMERYPKIELNLDFSDRLSDVIEDGMDIVIRGSELSDSRLISRRLGSFQLCIVGSPDYFRHQGPPPARKTYPVYRYPSSAKIAQWRLQYAVTRGGIQTVPLTLTCSSLEVLLYMVKQGRGIACLPDYSVKEALVTGEVEQILNNDITYTTIFHMLLTQHAADNTEGTCFCGLHGRSLLRVPG